MDNAISIPFIVDLVGRWVEALGDVWNTFIGENVVVFLNTMINILDNFPILELLNIALIPLRNVLDSLDIGNLTMLEFTLGFGFGVYVLFTFFRWLWNTFPVV